MTYQGDNNPDDAGAPSGDEGTYIGPNQTGGPLDEAVERVEEAADRLERAADRLEQERAAAPED